MKRYIKILFLAALLPFLVAGTYYEPLIGQTMTTPPGMSTVAESEAYTDAEIAALSGTYAELGEDANFGQCTCEDGATIGGTQSIITFDPHGESISNEDDDIILFQSADGTADQSIQFNLDPADAVNPVISSETSDTIFIQDRLKIGPRNFDGTEDETSFALSSLFVPSTETPSDKIITAINSTTILGGSSFLANSESKGIVIGTNSVTTFAGLGPGPAGSALIDLTGAEIFGGDGWAANSTGFGDDEAKLFCKDATGAIIQSAADTVDISGNALTLKLLASESASDGSETVLSVEEPTLGATNYQVVLEGHGSGAGIWLDSITGARISSPVANVIKQTGGRITDTVRIIDTASPYTVLATSYKIFCDTDDTAADGGDIEIDLPAGIDGTEYVIYNVGAGNVTIDPNGTETIDGGAAGVAKVLGSGVLTITYETTEGWW